MHGLKPSKGKGIAMNARLRAAVDEAESKRQQIDSDSIDGPHIGSIGLNKLVVVQEE